MQVGLYSILLGYGIGCLNPAWLIAKTKQMNLKHHGTGNLGATNTFTEVGRLAGVFVMVFDICKAILSIQLAYALFPQLSIAGVLAGSGTILGHIYPFYLRFRGGKGLACLGGLVLGLRWELFVPLLFLAVLTAFITDRGCMIPLTGAALTPFLLGLFLKSWSVLMVVLVPCGCMVLRHLENIRWESSNDEKRFRYLLLDTFGAKHRDENTSSR